MRTYPHHLTTDLPELPVPTLQESFERFRIASAALYDAQTEGDINQTIADFVIGPAPGLQDTLEEYAQACAASGSNWMAERWLEGYLKVREPLLLTSNVTFQLNLPTATTGVDRVVELLQRIGTIHILQAKRDTAPEVDARGQRMSMDGWVDFNGGIRTPAVDEDLWMRAGTGATYRTIGVLHLGRMWEVPLTGSEGKLLNTEQLRASVEYVLGQTQPAAQNFAGFSALGSRVLALDEPWKAADNTSLYNRLANMLFTITLDVHAEDQLSTLRRWAFHPGYAWVYKPISYLAALDDNMLAASVEHSVLDGGTLAAAVQRMQQVDLGQLDTQYDARLGDPYELVWQHVDYDLTGYTDRANRVRAEQVSVRRDEYLPYKISHDARAQLILMIAQQLTYGRVRAHYESCDMRHFRAGRTETVRPVTAEALQFVNALVQDQAVEAQFTAAVTAHTDWIKAAKSSKVFDRHMLMMQHIGQELGGGNAQIFSKYTRASEDFLSTSTMGTPDAITRFIFAPTMEDGFGVNYTMVDHATEYVVTWIEGTPGAEDFVANLQPAAELLYDFIASLSPVVGI